ncbi:MAG: zinc ribbon domain-containing protein [Planctomycetes bacterium]|nr:zinc ribbon domain-containing protein [Planctomycetota bacterium]
MAERERPRPYCSNCNYDLSETKDSPRCPECGRPLVEIMSWTGQTGFRFRSKATLWGLPAIDIALGPTTGERIGRARGVIAIGDRATGFVAMGGIARGVVAFGGVAIGVFSMGGLALGLLTAWGGLALAACADGGMALGLLVMAGVAVGLVASGGVAVGIYAAAGAPLGLHRIGPGANSVEASQMFADLSWFFGPGGGGFSIWSFIYPMITTIGAPIAVGALFGFLALLAHFRAERGNEYRRDE